MAHRRFYLTDSPSVGALTSTQGVRQRRRTQQNITSNNTLPAAPPGGHLQH